MTKQQAKPRDWVRIKILAVCCLFLLLFLLIAARAVHLQYFKAGELMAYAQHSQRSSYKLTYKRGAIFDRKGVEFASSLDVDSIYAEPTVISKPAEVATKLAKALNIQQAWTLGRLSSGKHFVWIKRLISQKESDTLHALNLEGVGFVKESRRFYPHQ